MEHESILEAQAQNTTEKVSTAFLGFKVRLSAVGSVGCRIYTSSRKQTVTVIPRSAFGSIISILNFVLYNYTHTTFWSI